MRKWKEEKHKWTIGEIIVFAIGLFLTFNSIMGLTMWFDKISKGFMHDFLSFFSCIAVAVYILCGGAKVMEIMQYDREGWKKDLYKKNNGDNQE